MSRLVDSVAVWVVCVAFMAMRGAGPFSIVGILVALIVICACQVTHRANVRTVILACFVAACALWHPLFSFLPVAACLCMFERSPYVRALWLIGWLVGCAQHAFFYAVIVLVLCAVGGVLAWRTSLDSAAWQGMRASRDVAREQMIGLAERNRAIQHELEGRALPHEAPHKEAAADPLVGLTERERQIATLVAEGLDNRAIADQLFLSEGTVRNNISSILQKKQLKNRTQLAVLCLSRGRLAVA